MESHRSFFVDGAKENGADSSHSLKLKEHNPSAIDFNGPLDTVPSSGAECDLIASRSQALPKGNVSTSHSDADTELRTSPSPSMQAIDALVTRVRENEYRKEIILLKDKKDSEWSFYPRHENLINTYHQGKKCYFNGVFRAYQRCSTEITLAKCFGRKKYDIDVRNGLPRLTPGDKAYLHPEKCPDFYKYGGTLPPVNFSRGPYVKEPDTFIPLEPLPQECHLPFYEKEKKKQEMNEIEEVKGLDHWQSAVPLMIWLFPPLPLLRPRLII